MNFKIKTEDNETLGAWFVLSDPYYHSLPSIPLSVESHVTTALKQRPTILFFHGNAATRAFHVRISHYQAFSSRLGANVLAIDYRGFAESTGQPSEEGLVRDGKAAWEWLISQGAEQDNILVVGHSLGTGVASRLGAVLGQRGLTPRGIVLLSVRMLSNKGMILLTCQSALFEYSGALEYIQYLWRDSTNETPRHDSSRTE